MSFHQSWIIIFRECSHLPSTARAKKLQQRSSASDISSLLSENLEMFLAVLCLFISVSVCIWLYAVQQLIVGHIKGNIFVVLHCLFFWVLMCYLICVMITAQQFFISYVRRNLCSVMLFMFLCVVVLVYLHTTYVIIHAYARDKLMKVECCVYFFFCGGFLDDVFYLPHE